MKKTVKISLGGVAFDIEEDAFDALDGYIKSLKNHLGNSPETDEIVNDIEERAGELLTEMLGRSQVITLDMVNRVIAILGEPEQIVSDEGETTSQSDSKTYKSDTKKRLYRDPDNAAIAGIGAGLGAYFGIDPLVFRILFIILTFANGFGLLAYIIFWISLPKAETTRQRMEMRGEAINFDNLEKNIKREYQQVKENLNKRNVSTFFEKIFSFFGKIFIALGVALAGLFKAIGVILAIAFICVGLLGITAAIGSIFFGGVVISEFSPSYTELALSEFLRSTFDLGSMLWVSIPVFLIVAIPLLAIIYVGLRMVLRFKVRDSVFFVLSASAWIVSFLVLAFVVFMQARSFTIRESVKEQTELITSETEIKTLTLTTQPLDSTLVIPEKPIRFDHYTVAIDNETTSVVGKPKLYFGKASGEKFEMVVVKMSRGGTKLSARNSAKRISLKYELEGSTLNLYPYFFLSKGDKWRAQEVSITINIPEGKGIYLDKSVEMLISTDQDHTFKWPDELVGKTWVMKGDELVEQ